jgi:hypothetical protein
MEAAPRMRMSMPPPGVPVVWVICTPDTLPCSFWENWATGRSARSLASMVATELERLRVDWVP